MSPTAQHNGGACLSCDDLHVSFYQDEGVGRAVRGVGFEVGTSRTLGIVGESGCGKSVTALSILKLVPCPPGKIERGTITFDGLNLLELDNERMRRIRGKDISMIFQDPMTSLNPVFTCGFQIEEPLRQHMGLSKAQARERALDMLDKVGIRDPRGALTSYPHQMSGGMIQRVMIAMALSCSPRVIIADEPTTALDVTVQARILDLLLELQQSLGMSMIMITHDLGIVCDVSHEVLVMYAGVTAESAAVGELFDEPLHPYTRALFGTIPYLDKKKARLSVIAGEVPNPLSLPTGCPFHPRCEKRFDRCSREYPPLYERPGGRKVRCFLYD
jgi:oligopeptide/dipeptide ABC transporter ATP-binding protein